MFLVLFLFPFLFGFDFVFDFVALVFFFGGSPSLSLSCLSCCQKNNSGYKIIRMSALPSSTPIEFQLTHIHVHVHDTVGLCMYNSLHRIMYIVHVIKRVDIN